MLELLALAALFSTPGVLYMLYKMCCSRSVAPTPAVDPKPVQSTHTLPQTEEEYAAQKTNQKFQDAQQKCIETREAIVKEIKLLPKDEEINLVIIGKQGAGKSSFVNTIVTALSGGEDVEKYAVVGPDSDHVTRVFTGHHMPGLSIRLLDTVGAKRKHVSSSGEIEWTYDGMWEAVFRREIDEGTEICDIEGDAYEEENPRENSSESTEEKTAARISPNHGVILVGRIEDTIEDNSLLYKSIQRARGAMSPPIPMIGIVTRTDKRADDQEIVTVSELLDRPHIREDVQAAGDQLRAQSFGMQCYDNRFKYADPWINLVALRAFRTIVHDAVGYINRRRERKRRSAPVEEPENPTENTTWKRSPPQ